MTLTTMLMQKSKRFWKKMVSFGFKEVPMQPKETKGTFSGYTKPKKSPLVLPFCKRYRSF